MMEIIYDIGKFIIGIGVVILCGYAIIVVILILYKLRHLPLEFIKLILDDDDEDPFHDDYIK